MATRIGALFVDLQLNTAKFVDELDKSRTKSTAFGVAVGTIFANIAASAGRMAADAALSIPRMIASQIDLADALGKTSQRIGISVESLSVLKHQAELADVSFDALTLGIGRFSRNVADAVGGNKLQAQAMRQLGVDIEGVRKGTVDIDEAFLQAADGVAGMGNAFQRADVVLTAFGKDSLKLVPLLNEGRQGFKDAGEEVDRFGIRITTAMARNAEQFNDNIKRMQSAGAGLGITLTNELLPPLAGFTNAMLDAIGPGKELHGLVAGFALPFKGLLEVLTLASGSLRILGRDFQLIGEVGILATKFDTEGIKVAFKQFETDVRKIREQTIVSLAEISGVKPLAPLIKPPAPEEFDPAKNALESLIASFDKALRPASALNKEILSLVGAGKQLSDIQRVYNEQIGTTVEQQELFGKEIPPLIASLDSLRKITQAQVEWSEQFIQTGARQAIQTTEIGTEYNILRAKADALVISIASLNEEMAKLNAIGQPREFTFLDDAIEKMKSLSTQAGTAMIAAGDVVGGLAKINLEPFQISIKQTAKVVQELADTGKQIGVAISGGIEEAMRKWEGFGNLAIGILDDIAATILRNAVTAPLSTWLGTIFSSVLPALAGGIGGGVGGGSTVLSSTAVAGPSSIGVPLFAKGGPVPHFAQGGEVPAILHSGEFVMNRSATNRIGTGALNAMNKGASLGRSGGDTYITIHAEGAEVGVEQRILTVFRQAIPGIVEMSVNAVQQRKLRTV